MPCDPTQLAEHLCPDPTDPIRSTLAVLIGATNLAWPWLARAARRYRRQPRRPSSTPRTPPTPPPGHSLPSDPQLLAETPAPTHPLDRRTA
jgi:hypothetical protein